MKAVRSKTFLDSRNVFGVKLVCRCNNTRWLSTRAFSFSCLVGKAHHVESFAEMGIVAA